MSTRMRSGFCFATLFAFAAASAFAAAALAQEPPLAPPAEAPSKEVNCADKVDDDGDGLVDCGDADCFDAPECKADGGPENSNDRCSDWIDNDGDGYVDCDDNDCEGELVTVCKGSWKGPMEAGGPQAPDRKGDPDEALPQLGEGQTVEDLIGKYGDNDGERNDILCADGLDNDNDGKIDCADFGCRFDPEVSVCRGNPGMRFSVVAHIAFDYDFEAPENTPAFDANFDKLQLRSFGPMPFIQDSFYLISMRAEKTPRVTFAMFQIPLGGGHRLNINSGGGGLSKEMVISTAAQLLNSPPYYLTNAFEQRNSAAAEVDGPIDPYGIVRYRAYVAGGSGQGTGVIGGRYYSFDNRNFSWSGGAAFQINALGRFSEWDSQFLFTDVEPTLAFALGSRYDERAQERFVAMYLASHFRWWRIALSAQGYLKKEFEFDSWQGSYNLRAGFLIVPKYLMLAADYGEFIAGDMEDPPAVLETELRNQLNEMQWRVGLHWYWWRRVGKASLLYTDRELQSRTNEEPDRERELRLEIQYRF